MGEKVEVLAVMLLARTSSDILSIRAVMSIPALLSVFPVDTRNRCATDDDPDLDHGIDQRRQQYPVAHRESEDRHGRDSYRRRCLGYVGELFLWRHRRLSIGEKIAISGFVGCAGYRYSSGSCFFPISDRYA